MRPAAALAAVLLFAAPARAGRGSDFGYEGSPTREQARVRLTPRPGGEATIQVQIDITYAPGSQAPRDHLFVGDEAPLEVGATTADGRPLVARFAAGPAIVVELLRPGEPPPPAISLRYEVPAPASRRHGLGHARAEVELSRHGFEVSGEVITTVDVPFGARLPGFACSGGECRRVSPRRLTSAPVLFRPPPDWIGLGLVALTVGASAAGFLRLLRKRAAEIAEEARAVPVSPPERPGGAYRAPPVRAVGATADATAALARLHARAALIAGSALASTLLLVALAAGRSPWPLPSVAATWIAMVGFVSALIVERA